MIRIRLATSIGIAWRIPSESGGEISGIGRAQRMSDTLIQVQKITELESSYFRLITTSRVGYKRV